MFLEMDSGQGWESSFDSAGLGSKVSTWETPPPMKRTMTDLAVGLKWGEERESAARLFCSDINDARASDPIPIPARESIWRRVIISVHVHKFVQVQQRMAKVDEF